MIYVAGTVMCMDAVHGGVMCVEMMMCMGEVGWLGSYIYIRGSKVIKVLISASFLLLNSPHSIPHHIPPPSQL
jgi:hypothetical protein